MLPTASTWHLATPEAKAVTTGPPSICDWLFPHRVGAFHFDSGQGCSENNKIFCMNLSAPFLIQFCDQMAECMPYTDYIFANESEAAEYGKAKGYAEDLGDIALKLAAQSKVNGSRPRVVVFTQGSECTIVASQGEVTRYDVDPSQEMLVDTNGAGTFVGGFLAQMYLKKPLPSASVPDTGLLAQLSSAAAAPSPKSATTSKSRFV